MTPLRQSEANRFADPGNFIWATGIEDTFITAPWPATGRTLDEYELTGHYEHWRDDLGLMKKLGVGSARYGIPWHRVNPERGKWDWDFVDRSLERLLELGIEPIVDLVHYGLPPWLENAFLAPDFPERMAEYASRVAERFRGRVHAYTPLNEPRITAWYCGRIGWWPPFRKGWPGFVRVMLAVCRGIVETVRALRRIDPEILAVHVDATDLYRSDDASLADEVAHRQELVFLALDLVTGRVREGHPLFAWIRRHGAEDAELAWFLEDPIDLPLLGLNLYPMFTLKSGVRNAGGPLRWRMPYAGAEIIEKLGELYWHRYHAPLFISETASVGSVRRRSAWLHDSVGAVRALRARGIPMIGYTWWPLFALVTWAYRQGRHPAARYLKQMGLWDLDERLRRIGTPLVDEFRALVANTTEHAGLLATTEIASSA